jgi:DDE family transposase
MVAQVRADGQAVEARRQGRSVFQSVVDWALRPHAETSPMCPAPTGSLLSFLADVPDPRSRHGRRHPLVAMLAHACCAILCGCRGIAPIAQWGRDQPIELMHRLGYTRRPPSFGAFQALFARLDADALEAAVSRWVEHLLDGCGGDGDGLRPVAIDGKSSRGSRTADAPAVHLLAALDQETGCVLAQARVPAETNEHKAALALLKGLVLEGRVVTGDAAFCQRDLCRQVVDSGGHYLIKVDDNQPTLKADIEAAFGPAFSPLRPAQGGPRARRGDDPGQARRPGRAAAAADDDDAQRLPRLAGGGAGRAAGADGHRRR